MKRGEIGLSPEALAYLHGRIDKEIEFVAASTLYCTATELAERMGAILLNQRIRVEHNVSTLREAPSTGSETVATLEMVSGTHNQSQVTPTRKGMSAEAKQKLSQLAKERWLNMTPRQRKLWTNKLQRARTKKAGK